MHEIYFKREVISLNVTGGIPTTELPRNIARSEPQTPVATMPSKLVEALKTLGWTGAAIIVKYFVIVDILINFMGRINV
jgi:hypothetical protein